MAVGLGFVAVPMRMLARHRICMSMQMMRIMRMHVLMLHQRMLVRVGMVLGQMQPDAKRHQARSGQQLPGHRLSQKQH